MRTKISPLFLILFVFLSCSNDRIMIKSEMTYSNFQNNLKYDMNYNSIVSKFGEPAKDIGSGIHIYVYLLTDLTEIWIGFVDRILYIKHLDKNQQLIENMRFLNSTGVITGPDLRMCICCGGWYIQIDQTTFEFDSLPLNSNIILQKDPFPIAVQLDWQLSDVSGCPDKRIIIHKITKD